MPLSDLNSPAFCIGHLALYASMVAGLVGHGDALSAPAGFDELFKNGAPCVDCDGKYPSKEVLVREFTQGWSKVADILATVDESVMSKPNPMPGLAQRLPTIGSVVAFMCLAHNMMHLGQISSWRRVMGLGSAM